MPDAQGTPLPVTAPPASPEQPSYAHPMAAFFLMFFKGAAIFIYIFCGWFPTDFVINFCLICFLLVCDFWTVGAAARPWGRAGGSVVQRTEDSTALLRRHLSLDVRMRQACSSAWCDDSLSVSPAYLANKLAAPHSALCRRRRCCPSRSRTCPAG